MPNEQENTNTEAEQEVDDSALEAAAGGSGGLTNKTEIVYASTFVPFDSSF